MKVMFTIHSVQGGGAERQCQLLAIELLRHDVDVLIACVDSNGLEKELENNVHVLEHSSKYDLRILREVSAAIRSFRPDVIHTWLPAVITIPTLLLSKRFGIPSIYSYRNRMFFHRPISLIEFGCVAACATRIVSNNEILQSTRLYQMLYRMKRGLTIENAVQVPDSRWAPRQEKAIGRPVQLLYVGRLTAQKNVGVLIEALAKLPKNMNWELCVFGAGELKSELENMVYENRLDQRISFLGFSENVQQHMREADCLIIPSLYEGMPNILLEALAVGVPVISSDILAARSVVRAAGIVTWFNPKSPDSLMEALSRSISSPGFRNGTTAVGDDFLANYSVENMSAKYLKVYGEYYEHSS